MSHLLAAQCASELNNIYDTVKTQTGLKNAFRELKLKYRMRSVDDNEFNLVDGSSVLLGELSARWEVKLEIIKPNQYLQLNPNIIINSNAN